jgi:hypothetical protein
MDNDLLLSNLRDTSIELLASGPLRKEALLEELRSKGLLDVAVELGDGDDWALNELDLEDLIEVFEDEVWISDDYWWDEEVIASTSQMLDGAMFTHFVSPEEYALESIATIPDLEVIDFNIRGGLKLSDGGVVERIWPDDDAERADAHGSLIGPPGWLSVLGGPGLAVFTRRGEELTVDSARETTDGDREQSALGAAFESQCPPGIGIEIVPIVFNALLADCTLFRRVTVPVTQMLAALGVEQREAWCGRAGEKWEDPVTSYVRTKTAAIGRRWGFDNCCHSELQIALEAWSALATERDGLDELTLRGAAKALRHSVVSSAFVDYVLGSSDRPSPAVAELAGQLTSLPGRWGAPGHYLLAANAERAGDAFVGESELERAVKLDADYLSALDDLAWYAADRGNARRAMTLLQLSGEGSGNPEYDFLVEFAPSDRRSVGRNELCPCGSGRKYKICCMNQRTLSIEVRSKWVLQKLQQYISRPQRRERNVNLVGIACNGDLKNVENVAPFIVDAIGSETETVLSFLEERGALLPDDERALLVEWLDYPWDLYEVIDVTPGQSMSLRGVSSGVVFDVNERNGSRNVEPGQMLLTRVARVGDEHQIIANVMPISLRLRESAISLVNSGFEPDDVAEWLASLSAPMQVFNREGHETVFCTTTLRPRGGNWLAATAALDDLFPGGADGRWTALVDINGESVVAANFERREEELVVFANSRERSTLYVDALVAQPGAPFEIVDVDVQSVAEVMSARQIDDGEIDQSDEDLAFKNSPEVQEYMANYIAEMERKWVDEPVPALQGLTPREALADPARRKDLETLLREFGEPDPSARYQGFSANRLRMLLDLHN